MKVKALTNIKRDDGWKVAGEEFDLPEAEAKALEGLVTPLEDRKAEPAEQKQPEAPAPEKAAKPARKPQKTAK